jgi:DNA end-binding protein Ku
MNLIEALVAEFEPSKYTDGYRDNILQMVEAKKHGQVVVEIPTPHREKVVDILDALKASLAAVKKPAASAHALESSKEAAEPRKRKARG